MYHHHWESKKIDIQIIFCRSKDSVEPSMRKAKGYLLSQVLPKQFIKNENKTFFQNKLFIWTICTIKKKNFPISDTKKRIFINAAIICYVEKLLCLIQCYVLFN